MGTPGDEKDLCILNDVFGLLVSNKGFEERREPPVRRGRALDHTAVVEEVRRPACAGTRPPGCHGVCLHTFDISHIRERLPLSKTVYL